MKISPEVRQKRSEARRREWAALTPEQRTARGKAISDGIRKRMLVRRKKYLAGELEPHAYVPSAMHMGDCQVCGHQQSAAIHK
jgi:hypothetical protein